MDFANLAFIIIFYPKRSDNLPPNGVRYPLGVGAWIRYRNGIPRKPEKGSKNAAHTPSRVHALLGNPMDARLECGSKTASPT